MPRNMSFALTEQQIVEGTKTVTRRFGWKFLKPGERLYAVHKCMGLKKGEKVRKLRDIRVLSVRREPLNSITPEDCVAEGFPGLSPDEFVAMLLAESKDKKPTDLVTRIEFEYL